MNADAHEAAVAAFMRQAFKNDPCFAIAVCGRYLVLNEDALRYRRGREESLSAARADWKLHAGLNGERIDD